jgi:hypothetical protein
MPESQRRKKKRQRECLPSISTLATPKCLLSDVEEEKHVDSLILPMRHETAYKAKTVAATVAARIQYPP